MLMAAGLGTRLRPFTELVPKPLLPLLGVPMAQFAVDALDQVGVGKIVANIHHLPDLANAGIRALEARYSRIVISDERSKLLGSAGGLRHALPLLGPGAPFFLCNADVIGLVNLENLAKRHKQLRDKYGVQVTLTVFPSAPAGQAYREILIDYNSGLIKGLGKHVESRPFFTGVAVIEPEAVASLPDGEPAELVPAVLEPAIKAGKAGVFLAQGPWLDIGSPQLWHHAHFTLIDSLKSGTLPPLWRRRIERANRQITSQGLVGRDSPAVLNVSAWAEPYYWCRRWSESGQVAEPPVRISKRVVLYGEQPAAMSGAGIGFSGRWTSVD